MQLMYQSRPTMTIPRSMQAKQLNAHTAKQLTTLKHNSFRMSAMRKSASDIMMNTAARALDNFNLQSSKSTRSFPCHINLNINV